MTISKSIELPINVKFCIMFYVDHNSTNAKTDVLIKALKTALSEYYEIIKEPQIITQSNNAKKAKLRVMSKIIKDGIIDVEQVKNVDVACSLLDEQIEFSWVNAVNATSYNINELVDGNYVCLGSTDVNKFKCLVTKGNHTFRIDSVNGSVVTTGVDFSFCK